MPDRLGGPARVGQRLAQVVLGLGQTGLMPTCCTADRLVEPARSASPPGGSASASGRADRLCVLRDGLVEPAAAGQGVGEIVVGLGTVGIAGDGRFDTAPIASSCRP